MTRHLNIIHTHRNQLPISNPTELQQTLLINNFKWNLTLQTNKTFFKSILCSSYVEVIFSSRVVHAALNLSDHFEVQNQVTGNVIQNLGFFWEKRNGEGSFQLDIGRKLKLPFHHFEYFFIVKYFERQFFNTKFLIVTNQKFSQSKHF